MKDSDKDFQIGRWKARAMYAEGRLYHEMRLYEQVAQLIHDELTKEFLDARQIDRLAHELAAKLTSPSFKIEIPD